MQCIQRCRFPLQHVHQETTTGQHPLAGDDQGDAAQIAADDVVLLQGEDLELVALETALSECFKVAVTQDLALEGLEVRANLLNPLKSVGHPTDSWHSYYSDVLGKRQSSGLSPHLVLCHRHFHVANSEIDP